MSKAWDEGSLAAAGGAKLSDNPYANSTEGHEEWSESWQAYHDLDEEGDLKENT